MIGAIRLGHLTIQVLCPIILILYAKKKIDELVSVKKYSKVRSIKRPAPNHKNLTLDTA